MIVSKIPRYLLYVLIIGVAVASIMLSMFYGQYRWLANEITTASAAEHETSLRASYERRMRAQMHVVADDLASAYDSEDSAFAAGSFESWHREQCNDDRTAVRCGRRRHAPGRKLAGATIPGRRSSGCLTGF